MLALYGIVRLVNSCHINIAHNNVECSTRAYTGTFAKSIWSVTPPPPPKTVTTPPGKKVYM